MFLDRFVQVMFGVLHSPLAPVGIFRVEPRHTGKQQSRPQRGC
jgi:hypothetical protein